MKNKKLVPYMPKTLTKEDIIKIAESLPAESTTKKLSARLKAAADANTVLTAVKHCERIALAKPLSDEQRASLVAEIKRLNLTKEQLERRARDVALNPDREFGNIGLRYWTDPKELCTWGELSFSARRLAWEIVGEHMLRLKHPDAKEVGAAALHRIEYEYELEFKQMLDEQVKIEGAKLKALCVKVAKMSTAERIALYDKAVAEKIFSNVKKGERDSGVLDHLHHGYFVAKIKHLI